MLIINNKALKVGNKWLNPVGSTPPTPPGPTFDEVTIGTQTWMAQDLDIDDGGEGIVTVSEITCGTTAQWTNHKFYTRGAAIRIANTIPGWRLPTTEDYNTLVSNIGGSSNVSHLHVSPWGDDSYEFGLAALTPELIMGSYQPTTNNYSNYQVYPWSYTTLVTSTYNEQMQQYTFVTFTPNQSRYSTDYGIRPDATGNVTINTVCAQVRLIKDT